MRGRNDSLGSAWRSRRRAFEKRTEGRGEGGRHGGTRLSGCGEVRGWARGPERPQRIRDVSVKTNESQRGGWCRGGRRDRAGRSRTHTAARAWGRTKRELFLTRSLCLRTLRCGAAATRGSADIHTASAAERFFPRCKPDGAAYASHLIDDLVLFILAFVTVFIVFILTLDFILLLLLIARSRRPIAHGAPLGPGRHVAGRPAPAPLPRARPSGPTHTSRGGGRSRRASALRRCQSPCPGRLHSPETLESGPTEGPVLAFSSSFHPASRLSTTPSPFSAVVRPISARAPGLTCWCACASFSCAVRRLRDPWSWRWRWCWRWCWGPGVGRRHGSGSHVVKGPTPGLVCPAGSLPAGGNPEILPPTGCLPSASLARRGRCRCARYQRGRSPWDTRGPACCASLCVTGRAGTPRPLLAWVLGAVQGQ